MKHFQCILSLLPRGKGSAGARSSKKSPNPGVCSLAHHTTPPRLSFPISEPDAWKTSLMNAIHKVSGIEIAIYWH